MSPASYLTAPPRDAGRNCSTGLHAPLASPRVWTTAIWVALIVGFIAGSAAIAYLVMHVLQCLRALKRLRRGVGKELERLADLGEATADRLETATDTAQVESSISRLRVDLARLTVLREALDEANATFDRIGFAYPRK